MKINFNDPNPGTWFNLDEDTAICIRVANERFTKELEKIPKDKKDAETWDYCIVDWKNLLDEDGQEISCTRENKIKLMTESVDFMMTVVYLIKEITNRITKRQEELEKNLSTT